MTIVLDLPIVTNQIILLNHPDTVLCNKQEGTCLLFNIAITEDANLILKKTEILSK